MSLTAGAKCKGRLFLGVALLCVSAALVSASEPTVPLGRAASFAVVAGVAVNNTGASTITGDVGVSPGTVATGFPPGTISGLLQTGNVASADARADLITAYNDAGLRTPDVFLLTPELGGLTLTGGVYNVAPSVEITSGNLTLNGRGDPNTVWIFQTDGFTIAPGRRVVLTNSARASRIFWHLNTSATIASNSVVKGNILTDDAITIESGANVEGRVVSLQDTVTIDRAVVRLPSGGAGPPPSGVVVMDSASSIVLNPQTGLMEQTVRVRNAGSNAVAGAMVKIKNLTNVTVYNATGRTPDLQPFVQYNIPLAVDESVDLVVEYLRPSRLPFAAPLLRPVPATPITRVVPVGRIQLVLRKIPIGTERMLVEFAAKRGQRYAVQYSDDGRIWKTAHPTVTASADRVWWVDYGAPKTEGKPTSGRAYRILNLLL